MEIFWSILRCFLSLPGLSWALLAGAVGVRQREVHAWESLARCARSVEEIRLGPRDLNLTEAHGLRIRPMHASGVGAACRAMAPVKRAQPLAVLHVTIFPLATQLDSFRIE